MRRILFPIYLFTADIMSVILSLTTSEIVDNSGKFHNPGVNDIERRGESREALPGVQDGRI